MAARLDRSDLPAIARNLGKAGRPMPQWVRDEPSLIAEYDQGTGAAHNRAAPHLPPDSAAPPRAAAPPAVQRPRAGRTSNGGFGAAAQRAQSGSSGIVSHQISAAGDGGGLLLAFILYPIALAILQHGAAGPGLWFRAKWLNQTPTQPNNLGQVPGAVPGTSGALPDPTTPHTTLPRPPGWKGQWPPPGTSAAPPPGTAND